MNFRVQRLLDIFRCKQSALAAALVIAIAFAIYIFPVVKDSSSADKMKFTLEDTGTSPPVDKSIRSVRISDIVFDTFDGGSVPLSRASDSLISRLRDAIRPIYEPVYEGPEGGAWLAAKDFVIGYASKDEAFAYPVKMLNSHELVNDKINGISLLISYCPLCDSGIVYDRSLNGRDLVFGNTSALYQNDLVMFDHQTGSYWFQVSGEAIVGTLTGSKLKLLPSVTIPWGQWKKLYPGTRVLSQNQNLPGHYNYDRDPFRNYSRSVAAMRFPFPVDTDKIGKALGPADIVVTVHAGNKEKVYPLSHIGNGVVNDNVGGVPVAVFSRTDGPAGNTFLRTVDGRKLTFLFEAKLFKDKETGTSWDFNGKAISGPLKGTRLQAVASRRAF
ncbi:MAG: hypothetical protein CMD96_02130 [Gammaproteobacteria bacterium]|nr:hypothetical protein [Gammaproteobacteria bacterium]HJP19011.1 DUF3179 domain-containing protein [Nitrospinota bacterium]|tara:strand:+ start:684 stop:1841 length:1158 start_codon:yes stop_codon:yes gene_type:complete